MLRWVEHSAMPGRPVGGRIAQIYSMLVAFLSHICLLLGRVGGVGACALLKCQLLGLSRSLGSSINAVAHKHSGF